MNNLIYNNKIYTPYEFTTVKEFEEKIINNSNAIFGEMCVDKKLLKAKTIPEVF